jgi:2-polyprenyl-3-methyl-5-hydroxy-6-metoxy-1,4-benzoquinol methylase
MSDNRFSFGRNWRKFVQKNFSTERVAKAELRLLEVLKLDNLQGYTFLDIGCGSGLHSLAALKCGASRVVSFDYDPDSVEITKYLRTLEGNPPHWEVTQGSVLDEAFMHALPQADIIYAWGVLHHTGDTWKALTNSRVPLSPNGVAVIALYSYTCYYNAHLAFGNLTPEQWLEIKQRYNKAGFFAKKALGMAICLSKLSLERPGTILVGNKTAVQSDPENKGFLRGDLHLQGPPGYGILDGCAGLARRLANGLRERV